MDLLQRRAWYLPASASGKLLLRNVENINARLENYAQQAMNDARETTLRERLDTMFKPITQAVYQSVELLPALNAVTLVQNKTTLVTFRPAATALDEIKDFYEHQQWKNRVLFLTGDLTGSHRVLEATAYLRAIEIIIAEIRSKNDTPRFTTIRRAEASPRCGRPSRASGQFVHRRPTPARDEACFGSGPLYDAPTRFQQKPMSGMISPACPPTRIRIHAPAITRHSCGRVRRRGRSGGAFGRSGG